MSGSLGLEVVSVRLLSLALLVACTGSDPDTGEPVDTQDSGDSGDSAVDVCGSANRALPDGVVELAWDDGVRGLDVTETTWGFDGYTDSYTIAQEPLHEAVRFELDRPTKVWGFSVQWSHLPDEADPTAELEAGLYADHGHNGFDFWQWDALRSGTRCLEDVTSGEWVTYAFEEPLVVEQPGLLYVAHRRPEVDDPVFAMDGTYAGEGSCGSWDDCHSAVNLPETETAYLEVGWSFPIPYDYLVRLHVEYTADPVTEPVFEEVLDLPLGNRTSWGDFDGDGDDDLLTRGPKLYRNDGDGGFVDVTAESGVDQGAGSGGVWGDFDNDGCLDLFTFAENQQTQDVLLRSRCDGTFEDVTVAAGIDDSQTYNTCGDAANVHAPTSAAAWWDVDGDGRLDLYLSQMICWADYTFFTDDLFHNEGDGTFVEWGGDRGFLSTRLAGRGAAPVDWDGDADVDLFVNNYVLQRNLAYVNQGDGTVDEAGADLGLAGLGTKVDAWTTYFGHTIGSAWGDLDNDGDLDAIAANLAHPRFFSFSNKTQVLRNDGEGFVDLQGDWEAAWKGGDAGLRYQETHSVPALADFDSDGALDLVITAVYDGRPTDFYWGRGDGTFELDVRHAGITTENGWGAAVSDFDNDGDVDLATYQLWRNRWAPEGDWLQVRVLGDGETTNTMALGATVTVHVGDEVRVRHVSGGNGQGGQDSMYLHFGVPAATIDTIDVTWPGVGTETFTGPFDANQRLWLMQGGATHAGWGPPS